MAKRIYFPDGSHEDILNTEDPREEMQRVIRERLGSDFEELYLEVTSCPELEGDDWERVADGYRGMLHDALDEINGVLDMFDASRLNRDKVFRRLSRLRQTISSNL